MRTIILIIGLLFFTLPAYAYAALININTADAVLLDTLPGIGPTYAGRIVDYRTANGPFARIEDIQKVSGIGPSTYANIAPLITVGDTTVHTPSVPTASTTVVETSSGGASTYVPPPSTLTITLSGASQAILEVPLRLSARVTTKSGAVDTNAQIIWSFGDGSSGEGIVVEKTYHYPGTYLVTARAYDGATTARSEIAITALAGIVHIANISGEGVTVTNDSDERLDLSGWRITSSTGMFRIPEGMTLLPKSSVLLAFRVMQLPVAFDATLTYPSGVVATQYVPSDISFATTTPIMNLANISEQLPTSKGSYQSVQKVETIISTPGIVQVHEETVLAPAAATELAAAGAVVPPATGTASPVAKIFHSPWALGLLSVMVMAAGAFILL